jgi:hypothetical protein
MSNPFDYLNSINYTKEDLLKDALPEDEKKYASFMVNRGLSYFPDTVAIANEMNRNHHIDNKLQYDFLRTIVRKRKRFSKWAKPDHEENLKVVMERYGYSRAKAESVIDLFSKEQIESMKRVLSKGGKSKNYK